MVRLIRRLFVIKTRWEALAVIYALALGGLWLFLFTRELKTRSLLPDREPALKEALGHA